MQQSAAREQEAGSAPAFIGDPIENVIGAFDSRIIRLYSRGRFTILREIFLEENGQYLPEDGKVLDLGCDFGFFSLSKTSQASGAAFIVGVHHVTSGMSRGAAFSVVNYHQGRDSGMNGAFINVVHDTTGAFNLGFVTYADGPTLVDLGGINISRSSTVQLGFLNITERLDAFQFGFLNMAENGFLPIFPIFNFPVR